MEGSIAGCGAQTWSGLGLERLWGGVEPALRPPRTDPTWPAGHFNYSNGFDEAPTFGAAASMKVPHALHEIQDLRDQQRQGSSPRRRPSIPMVRGPHSGQTISIPLYKEP